jgi:hypothetical protein
MRNKMKHVDSENTAKRRRGGPASELSAEWASTPHRPSRAERGAGPAAIHCSDAMGRKSTTPPKRRGGPASEPQANIADAPPKRRGAQPGNTNAVRHGFYSAAYKAQERSMLADLPLTDLSAEINLIRITNPRFLQALKASKGELDLQTQLTALRAVNLSAHSIATLLRARALRPH